MFIKRSGGKKEFKAINGMSVSQGDSIRTNAKSSVNIIYDNDAKTTVGPSSQVVVTKLSDTNGGKHSKVTSWSGKLWNSVDNLINLDDKFEVETPTAVMGVRGTLFLVSVDPETGRTTLSVLDGVVAARNAQSAPDGTRAARNQNTASNESFDELLVRMNERIQTEPETASETNEIRRLNPLEFVDDTDSEILAEVVADLERAIERAKQRAGEQQRRAQEEIDRSNQHLLDSIRDIERSELLARMQENIIAGIHQTNKTEAVDELLERRNKERLEQIERNLQQLRKEIAKKKDEIIDEAKDNGITEKEIEETRQEFSDVPEVTVNERPTRSGSTRSAGNGGSSSDSDNNSDDGSNDEPNLDKTPPKLAASWYVVNDDTGTIQFLVEFDEPLNRSSIPNSNAFSLTHLYLDILCEETDICESSRIPLTNAKISIDHNVLQLTLELEELSGPILETLLAASHRSPFLLTYHAAQAGNAPLADLSGNTVKEIVDQYILPDNFIILIDPVTGEKIFAPFVILNLNKQEQPNISMLWMQNGKLVTDSTKKLSYTFDYENYIELTSVNGKHTLNFEDMPEEWLHLSIYDELCPEYTCILKSIDVMIYEPLSISVLDTADHSITITWNNANADWYDIYLNGTEIDRITTGPPYSYTFENLEPETTYTIMVKANNEIFGVIVQAEVNITTKGAIKQLAIPEEAALDGDFLYWNSVEFAAHYIIEITNDENSQIMRKDYNDDFMEQRLKFDLSQMTLEPGIYTITISAVADGFIESDPVTLEYIRE